MKNPISVDAFIANSGTWKEALKKLRDLVLSSGLKEEVKWGGPVYTLDGKNLVGIGAFKSYAGLWFYQGALLSDPHHLLINASEGVTKALRQMRFGAAAEIDENIVKNYLEEAIRNHREGRAIKPDLHKPLIVPAELAAVFAQIPELETAFDQLKLTFKREYAEYIETAKTAETKARRLEKIIPMILANRGLNDIYR